MALSMKGYRVISVDIPRVWNHHEWIQAFEKFLDAIDVHHIHLYGTSLGGFLAQLFAQHRPRRVRSLVLSNTFLDTHSFAAAMPWAPIVSWTPSFLLKRYVLTGIHDGPHEPFIADSVDFVVCQVETLSREDLASRLTLTADSASVGNLLLSDSHITIMDTNDYCATPQQLKDQLSERYSGARQAYMKTGGDFPFLSRPDEVNLHLQLHLRRVGVEAQPDLVRGISRDGSGGDPSESNDRKEDSDNPPQDDEGNFESPSTESQLPAPESSEPHSLNELPLSTAKCCFAGQGDAVILLPFPLLREQITVSEILLQLTLVTLVPHLVGWLYITSKHWWKSRQLV
ncbi:Maspardin [Citrus sinensis]|nr:Maspardin [Citrus sinensis]